jgi:hypothetical protein
VGEAGQFVGPHSFDADDDVTAIDRARELLQETTYLSMELWNLGRRVAAMQREA